MVNEEFHRWTTRCKILTFFIYSKVALPCNIYLLQNTYSRSESQLKGRSSHPEKRV